MAHVHLHNSCSHEWWYRRPFHHLDMLTAHAKDRRCTCVHGRGRLCRIGLNIVELDVFEVVGVPG
eukprot:9482384-Pyramimonas_sp.AAC.1